MSIRIREHATAEPAPSVNLTQSPPEWTRFNLARRIVQVADKAERKSWMDTLRCSETPDFMLALDIEVRRQWPLRYQPFVIPPELVAIMQQQKVVVE